MKFGIYIVGVYARNLDEGIVFGVARSVKPRSNSASADAKPSGIEAPVTIPSSSDSERN